MGTVSSSHHSLGSSHSGHLVSTIGSRGPQMDSPSELHGNAGLEEPGAARRSLSVSGVRTSTLTVFQDVAAVSQYLASDIHFPSPSILPAAPTPLTNSHRSACSPLASQEQTVQKRPQRFASLLRVLGTRVLGKPQQRGTEDPEYFTTVRATVRAAH